MKNPSRARRGPLSALTLVGAALFLSSCSLIEASPTPIDHAPSQQASTGPAVMLGAGDDYVTKLGAAKVEHQVDAGTIGYCPLDKLSRAACAYGSLTHDLRVKVQKMGRQDITVDPAGWGINGEVDIPALAGVKGSRAYHGWMFNRSHLLADSLGGDPTKENLITGTRTQNVGSHQAQGQYAGGMAYTELLARDYLAKSTADACPLYYAATPVYTGDELIPRTVTVDIQSCDKSIDERVSVSNTANGFTIDYKTGAYAKD